MEINSDHRTDSFKYMFYPRAIAVVGASTHLKKVGNFVLRSAILSKVERVYPIHSRGASEILGIKAYPSIDTIPDDHVDLFLFAIPQKHILSSFKSAIAKGCRAAVIFTAGYKEVGKEGELEQIALRDLANDAGVKIIGPNTMGFFRSDSLTNATFMPTFSDIFTKKAKITIICQSGGVAGFIANQLIEHQLPVGTIVCLGNRANVDFADILDFCVNDAETEIVALFIEGIDNLRSFYTSAERCALKKPVIVLGAGYTSAGRRVAQSHTGSISSSEVLYKAAFRQAGLFNVNNIQELVDTVKIIYMNQYEPAGNRIAIVTHTAGPAILASDILENGGLDVTEFSDSTKKKLIENNILPSFMPAYNPVDLATFGYMERHRYIESLKLLTKDENVDATLTLCMSSLGDPNTPPFPIQEFKEVIEASKKPAAFVWGGPDNFKEEFKEWMEAGIPTYSTPERASIAMVNLVRYTRLKQRTRSNTGPMKFQKGLEEYIRDLLITKKKFVPEHKAKKILELAEIKVAKTILATNEKEAINYANKIGYPLVMKIVSEKVIHKSDLGGVKLNLNNKTEVIAAFHQIHQNVSKHISEDMIQGVSIQPMIPKGPEVIIGAMHDQQAGPVVMFGLGGIWVETLKDVTFRLAPLSSEDAMEMIQEIKGHSILKGIRGEKAVNISYLIELIIKVSHLIDQFPIEEIDLNPIIFYNSKYAVADARILFTDQ